jgi:hypothetical protein
MDRDTEAINDIIRRVIGHTLPLDGLNDRIVSIGRADAQQIAGLIFNELEEWHYLVPTLPTDRRITITNAITDAIGNKTKPLDEYPRGEWQAVSHVDWTWVVDAIHENLVRHGYLVTGADRTFT